MENSYTPNPNPEVRPTRWGYLPHRAINLTHIPSSLKAPTAPQALSNPRYAKWATKDEYKEAVRRVFSGAHLLWSLYGQLSVDKKLVAILNSPAEAGTDTLFLQQRFVDILDRIGEEFLEHDIEDIFHTLSTKKIGDSWDGTI